MIFNNESDVREYLKFIIDDLEDTDEMCHYDMESIRSIIEIKVRKSYYDKWMIEKYKYDKLMNLCGDKGCYYVVAHKNMLYWYNLKDIDISELELVVMDCPTTTEFKNKNVIKKRNYILPNNKKEEYDTNN